jgi:hypothetical protein
LDGPSFSSGSTAPVSRGGSSTWGRSVRTFPEHVRQIASMVVGP